jgi:hypothetical protein
MPSSFVTAFLYAFSPSSNGASPRSSTGEPNGERWGNDMMRSALGIVGLFAALAAAPGTAVAQSVSLHGFADVSFKNDYVTPRGLAVTT